MVGSCHYSSAAGILHGPKALGCFSPFKGPPTVQKSLDCGLTTVIFFLATPSSLQDISSLTRD